MTIMVVHGVPAKRDVWKTLTLKDGTEVHAQLVGDEHSHFWQTDDGKAYLINKDGIAQVVDANEIITEAKPRRQLVNDQRTMRMKGQIRVGEVGCYTGKKRPSFCWSTTLTQSLLTATITHSSIALPMRRASQRETSRGL